MTHRSTPPAFSTRPASSMTRWATPAAEPEAPVESRNSVKESTPAASVVAVARNQVREGPEEAEWSVRWSPARSAGPKVTPGTRRL